MTKLVLIRHGQSIWNLENRFTGWIDVPLSSNGEKEAKVAAKILRDFKFDLAFTSTLQRAQNTLGFILEENKYINSYRRIHESNSNWYDNDNDLDNENKIFKVYTSERLNERYYGDLQGLNKEDTVKKFGEEQVHLWRRSYDIAPPNGESLKLTYARTLPYFKKNIQSNLVSGKNILIVAHGNSLRSIIMYLESLNEFEILDVEIPTGTPIVYKLDLNMKILSKKILS